MQVFVEDLLGVVEDDVLVVFVETFVGVAEVFGEVDEGELVGGGGVVFLGFEGGGG